MASTILAVAIGETDKTVRINSTAIPSGVRRYISGLISGLTARGKSIGDASDYVIDYRECTAPRLETFVFNSTLRADCIFCMSTTVVRRADNFTKQHSLQTPIVGIVSDYQRESFGGNVCGVSAQRSQQARQCYEHLLRTVVPGLNKAYVLHDPNYDPSKDSLRNITGGHHPDVVNVSSPSDIQREIGNMPQGSGLLLLPVDWFFGAAEHIIGWARAQKLLDFWPVTDWVRSTPPSAFGGYGAPQERCGELLAERVASVWDGTMPARLWVHVDSSDFVWRASEAVARALGVTLSSAPNGPEHV